MSVLTPFSGPAGCFPDVRVESRPVGASGRLAETVSAPDEVLGSRAGCPCADADGMAGVRGLYLEVTGMTRSLSTPLELLISWVIRLASSWVRVNAVSS